MDFQPKFKAQTPSTLFADGRSMRPRVRGTVARGQLNEDSRVHLGIASSDEQPTTNPGATGKGSEEADVAERDWVTDIPLPVTSELMDRGRERFDIHCAVCHGKAGQGNGLASLRALELEQGTWVPPTSIHAEHVREQPLGQLFNVITNGVRKMPAYGHQIPPEDRWAIVLYLRALQRSQHASIDDVPEEIQPTLREMN
jgi:mono/diheme cytochrome c family protein